MRGNVTVTSDWLRRGSSSGECSLWMSNWPAGNFGKYSMVASNRFGNKFEALAAASCWPGSRGLDQWISRYL